VWFAHFVFRSVVRIATLRGSLICEVTHQLQLYIACSALVQDFCMVHCLSDFSFFIDRRTLPARLRYRTEMWCIVLVTLTILCDCSLPARLGYVAVAWCIVFVTMAHAAVHCLLGLGTGLVWCIVLATFPFSLTAVRCLHGFGTGLTCGALSW
jgi:hypothetical protein